MRIVLTRTRSRHPIGTIALFVALALAACATPAPPATPRSLPEPSDLAPDLRAPRPDPSATERPAPQNTAAPPPWWMRFGEPELNALVRRAETANPDLVVAAARARQAQAALALARSGLWPTLGLTAGATRSGRGESLGADSAATSLRMGFSASWEPDLWGRIGLGVQGGQAAVRASLADLAGARLALQATVVQTWLSLQTARALERLLADTADLYQRSLDVVRNRYEAGVAPRTDIHQAETQLANTVAQRLDASLQGTQLEHALQALTGQLAGRAVPGAGALQGPVAPQGVDPIEVLPDPPDVPDDLPAGLLQRRPDVVAAAERVVQAQAEAGIAERAWWPELSLSAGANTQGVRMADLFSLSGLVWSLGPALAQSLFDGGARTARLEDARAGLEAAGGVWRGAVLEAVRETRDTQSTMQSLVTQQQVQAQALEAARRSAEQVDNQYRAGTVSYLNVVTAQAALLSAQRTALDLRSRRLIATLDLIRSVGGDWTAAIEPARAAPG